MLVFIGLMSGCASMPKDGGQQALLNSDVMMAMAHFQLNNPAVRVYLSDAYGYAIFPKVLKGAFWYGGATGTGQVYEQGQLIGYTTLNQATLGFSFGGEAFRELIFFKDQESLDKFKEGSFAFSAQATAVAADTGLVAKADYQDGMAVLVETDTGLMVDASVGGQEFKYEPKIRNY